MGKSTLIIAIALLISTVVAIESEIESGSELGKVQSGYAVHGPTIGRLHQAADGFEMTKHIFS